MRGATITGADVVYGLVADDALYGLPYLPYGLFTLSGLYLLP